MVEKDTMDLFSSLAHETRRRIIWELGESARSERSLSFSELMEAVGVEDTGTFGFHLKALGPAIHQDRDSRYALSALGGLAYDLISLARSSDLESMKDGQGRPSPRMIFEVRVEGDESREPISLGVRSTLEDREQRRRVISFMIKKLKEMEEADLELVGELKVYSSTDGNHTELSEDWKTKDRRKWRGYVVSKLNAELGK